MVFDQEKDYIKWKTLILVAISMGQNWYLFWKNPIADFLFSLWHASLVTNYEEEKDIVLLLFGVIKWIIFTMWLRTSEVRLIDVTILKDQIPCPADTITLFFYSSILITISILVRSSIFFLIHTLIQFLIQSTESIQYFFTFCMRLFGIVG